MSFENKNSFHGNLIKTVVDEWVSKSLFEMVNEKTLNKLQTMLDSYIPTIETYVKFDLTTENIDKGFISGSIVFIDEKDEKRVIDFTILNTGTIISENEKN